MSDGPAAQQAARPPARPSPDPWADLAPTFGWRPSQRRLLGQLSRVTGPKRHIVAPPGSGKTLVGMELARQAGTSGLVLAPTVAVRDQWRRATGMFGADPERFTSDDPLQGRPLTCVTYQLLGDPGRASAALEDAARRLWLQDVATAFPADTARRRVEALERNDPPGARRELNQRVRALRRSLATGEDVGVPYRDLLGPRTNELLETLAANPIGCVVLDECHHLLDWWALVVRALLDRLRATRPVTVVGLTATPPDPASELEARNYAGLLGDVDAELPLPAMVAEGGVAPWRDAVRLTSLTAEEAAFIRDRAGSFAGEIDSWLTDDSFVDWAVAQVLEPGLDAQADPTRSGARGWDRFWDRDPLAAAALYRWWQQRGMALPAGFDPPPGAAGALDLDGRLLLLDAWLHDPDAEVATELREKVTRGTARHGVSLTSGGPRWGRGIADLVCSRSAAKGPAAAAVLADESAWRGDELRALVVAEHDAASTPPAEARRVLGEDPGTAARIMAALCSDGRVARLGVMAVTGRGAWVSALAADDACATVNVGTAAPARWVTAEGSDIPGAVHLAGHGPGWTPGRWLEAAAELLDRGVARVLLATRALVGEGWDHPGLNVLVDLSEGASPAATTQVRGRALRLDPAHPGKVASLWDVTVVDPGAPGDWDRLRRRHRSWWGPDGGGRVVTGPAKLHPLAARRLPPSRQEMELVNAAGASAMSDHAATLAAWAGVDPAGTGTAVVHVGAHRVRTSGVRVRPRLQGGRRAVGAGLAVLGAGFAVAAGAPGAIGDLAPGAVLLAGSTGLLWSSRARTRADQRTFAALAAGVLAGLQAVRVEGLDGARVTVQPGADDTFHASLLDADGDAAEVWAESLSEALGPLGRPRWIVADGHAGWRVPTRLGAQRAPAEAFVKGFRRHVAGARLVRAGTPEATELVLADAGRRAGGVDRTLRWAPGGGRVGRRI